MKTPLFAALGALLFAVGGIHADPSAEKPSLPPGPPVMTQMPDFAQWTVDYSYADGADPASSSPQAGLTEGNAMGLSVGPIVADMRLVRVVYTKTGTVRHEEWSFDKGSREVWAMGDVIVRRGPESSALVPNNDAGLEGNVFPELDWLSKETFTGTQTKDGVQYLVFKKNWYNDDRSFVGTSIAYIDPDTRYPASFQFGNQTRRYTIQAPPTVPLAVPPDFAAAGTAMTEQIQKATPHLAPP